MKNKIIAIVLFLLVLVSIIFAVTGGRSRKHRTADDLKVREQVQTIDSAGTNNGAFVREKVQTLDSTSQYIK